MSYCHVDKKTIRVLLTCMFCVAVNFNQGYPYPTFWNTWFIQIKLKHIHNFTLLQFQQDKTPPTSRSILSKFVQCTYTVSKCSVYTPLGIILLVVSKDRWQHPGGKHAQRTNRTKRWVTTPAGLFISDKWLVSCSVSVRRALFFPCYSLPMPIALKRYFDVLTIPLTCEMHNMLIFCCIAMVVLCFSDLYAHAIKSVCSRLQKQLKILIKSYLKILSKQ